MSREQHRLNKRIHPIIEGFFISIIIFTTVLSSGCIQPSQKGLPIVVIGRDSASGTREFFWQYVMKKENFTPMLREKNSNGGVYISVSQTPGAIGYISLGYVDNGVKALRINNITVNTTNVLNGLYPIARDLNLFTKGNATGATLEFIEFIQSTQGQAIVREEGYVPLLVSTPYNSTGKHLSGILTISGSTTVFPIAEKARETFVSIYPDLSVTVSSTGSGAGIKSVSEGTVNIGMSSRDLQPSETGLGLVKYIIAKDGIAIITNVENSYSDALTLTQLKSIYRGEITNWDQLT